MKNCKKLLLCIGISVAVTMFVGTTLGVIQNYMFVYYIVSQEKELEEGMSEDAVYYAKEIQDKYFDNANFISQDGVELAENTESQAVNEEINAENLEQYIKYILKETRINTTIGTYCSTAAVINGLYIYSIVLGVLMGILVYVIFIKKIKAKKIILLSVAGFAAIYLILNIGDLVSDITYSMKEHFWGINLENYINEDLNKLFIIYIFILAVLYIVNIVHQKKIARNLNEELNLKNK